MIMMTKDEDDDDDDEQMEEKWPWHAPRLSSAGLNNVQYFTIKISLM